MLLEIIIALTIGVLIGTLTGLCPGIHINLVGAMLISSLAFFLNFFSPTALIVFVVAMGITHTYVDFIPSIFLGAPEEDTILSVLPGHLLLKQGLGYEAVYLSTLGSFIAIIIILIFTPIFLIILPLSENFLKIIIPYVLILSSILLIYQENNKIPAVIIFLLSGFLGIGVLNSQLKEPLLPLLSGLFGVSSLFISIKTKTQIPNQIIKNPEFTLKNLKKPVLASIIFSPLCSIFPAIGSGQASALGASFFKISKKGFIVLVGTTNTIVLGLSFIVLYTIDKSRTGVAATVGNIIPELSSKELILILASILITGIICFYWTLFLAKRFSNIISKVNYSYLSIFIIILVCLIVIAISGIFGFIVLIISTSVGIYGILSGARRINLIGCLMLPTILLYVL